MANFAPLFLTALGRHERLLPADGGLEVNVVDCVAANSAVSLFSIVNSTGTVSLFGAHNGTANFGAAGGTLALAGGLSVAQNSLFTGNVTVNGNTQLGNLLTADTLTLTAKVASSIVFTATAPRTIEVTSQNLTVQTVTGGTLAVTSAVDLDIDAATSSAFNAVTSMVFAAGTAASFAAGAGSDLTLGARGATVTLNQASSTALVGFTATSLIGAVNELRTNVHDTVPTNNVGEAIVAGNLVCLDFDAGAVKLYKCDNTVSTRNRPVGVALASQAVVGQPCSYTTAGNVVISTALVPNTEGDYLFMALAGEVSTSAPVTGTVMVVGVHSKAGVVGSAEMIYQPLLPTTL